jgi:hypothetical protein
MEKNMAEEYFTDFDFSDFWDDDQYSLENYVEETPSDELIKSVEEELGYKLPNSYIALMKLHNGGMPLKTCFPTKTPTSWSENHVAITGIMGGIRRALCEKWRKRNITTSYRSGYVSKMFYF